MRAVGFEPLPLTHPPKITLGWAGGTGQAERGGPFFLGSSPVPVTPSVAAGKALVSGGWVVSVAAEPGKGGKAGAVVVEDEPGKGGKEGAEVLGAAFCGGTGADP